MTDPAGGTVDVLAAEEDAYKASLRDPVTKQAIYVLEALGSRRAAAALGLRDARPLRGWADGRPVKEAAVRERLRILYRCTRALTQVYSAETAAAFWQSSNPYLGDRSPLAVLAGSNPGADRAEGDILAALRALMEG